MIDMFAKGGGSGVIFPFSTAAQSPALYKADIHTLKVEALTQPLLQIEAQFHDYSAISADGASVPYNVIARADVDLRSEEHTYELQSLMRISYDVFCLQKNTNT